MLLEISDDAYVEERSKDLHSQLHHILYSLQRKFDRISPLLETLKIQFL